VAAGLSTYEDLWKGVNLRCPAASLFLCRDWIDFAFRTLWDRRLWSWQRKKGQFLFPALVNDGLVTVNHGDLDVTGVGTTWTTDIVQRQFRIGLQTPIYTIADVDVGTQILTLSEPWGGPSATAVGYRIYQAYVTVPTDFESFIAVYDPNFSWRLLQNVSQEDLDLWDAQRATQGTPAWVTSPYGFDEVNDPPLMRYEVWPHVQQEYVLTILYTSRPPDLSDPGASLPRAIRGDVLLEMALAQCARWPGPSKDAPNPYFNLQLAQQHDARAERGIMDMAVTDDETAEQDAWYHSITSAPWVSFPFGDSRYMQSHDW
jgi:hypothetical protein